MVERSVVAWNRAWSYPEAKAEEDVSAGGTLGTFGAFR